MHRKPLLALLDAYQREWPDESSVAQRIRDLVVSNADCFDRACRPGHITGSAWVVSADQERHLLLHHRKLDKWLQPGGHADGDPDAVAVARREAEEESGLTELRLIDQTPLDLDVHLIPARFSSSGDLIEDEHEHHDLRFLFLAGENETLQLSEESNELRWCTPDEVLQRTKERSVLRLLEKARSRLHTTRCS